MSRPSNPSSFVRRIAIALVFVAAIAIVWHPIVFGGYTISDVPYASSGEEPYGAAVIPVVDPAAGACQDEPWLALIGRSLRRHGEIPLVNMQNGLGAPLAESLQPGVFYVLNPLLALSEMESSVFFDTFELLHVLVYGLGLYALLRHFARSGTAVCVALLVALSGVTSQHVNMVHFRTHAWMPWMACAAVALARGDRRKRTFALLVFSEVALVTCGALQEAFLSSLAVGVIFAIEWWTSARERVAPLSTRLADAARFTTAITCAAAIAAVAYLPYMLTRAGGDIQTATNPLRVLTALSPHGLTSFLVPGSYGFHPYLFASDVPERWISDFSTIGVFVCVAGAIALLFGRGAADRARFVCYAIVLALGLAKLSGLRAFDFLQYVPFLNEILVVKYHAWIFDITAIVAVLGLESLLLADRRVARWSVIAGLFLVVGASLALLSGAWTMPLVDRLARLPPDVVEITSWTYGASAVALVTVAALIVARPRGLVFLLGAVIVAQAAIVRPDGWKARRESYAAPIESEAIAKSNGEAPPRVLSLTLPNQNLIHGFESIGVFDPINSVRLYSLLARGFTLDNSAFILAPKPEIESLPPHSMKLLRFMGVERMYGFRGAEGETLELAADDAWIVGQALPRVWLLPAAEVSAFDDHVDFATLLERVDPLREAVLRAPRALDVRVETNAIEFRAPEDFTGVLVAHQIHMQAWEFEGRSSRRFMQSFPAWDVELVAGRTYRIEYVPLGLRKAAWISAIGVLLAIVFAFVGSRRSSVAQTRGERAASA